MNKQSILALLHNVQIAVMPITYTGGGSSTPWLNIRCPFAPYTHAGGADNTPSFGITIKDDGASHYKCFACGVHGRFAGLPTRIGGYRKVDYTQYRREAELAELDTVNNRVFPQWDSDDEETAAKKTNIPNPDKLFEYPIAVGLPYLRQRGIMYPTVHRLGLRYDSYQRRVLFPVYDRLQRFRGFTGRSILPPEKLSKRNPKVRDYFGLDKRNLLLSLPKQKDSKFILVEGLFDYARLVAAGHHGAAANLGTALTMEKVDIIITKGEPVYLLMDNDLAGWSSMFGIRSSDDVSEYDTSNAWAYQLYTELMVWIIPYTRPLDGADPGSLSKDELDYMISNAWLFAGESPMDEIGEPTLCLS